VAVSDKRRARSALSCSFLNCQWCGAIQSAAKQTIGTIRQRFIGPPRGWYNVCGAFAVAERRQGRESGEGAVLETN
jgi:hypothetical protein